MNQLSNAAAVILAGYAGLPAAGITEEGLVDVQGMVDFLTTEFCLSNEKNFPMVEFIDTPGNHPRPPHNAC